MTNDKQIEVLKKGIASSLTPDNLKEEFRKRLTKLEELEKESTSDKKPKFKVGDVVVLKGETTLEKEITSYKQNSKGEFVYKAKYVSKPEATGEWNEEELELILQETAKPKVGDIITFVESSNVDAPTLKGTVEKINQLGLVVFIDGKQYEVRKLIDIKIVGKDKKIKPSSDTPIKKATKKYYRNKEIKSVTVLENGKKVTYAGKDVLNGANFFKEGGALVSKAKYVPVRNIVEVTFEDGSKDKPRNGYHIKNGATPIKNISKSKEDLEKELKRLQRELNSSRLSTYREGDNSTEAQNLKDETSLKLKRFNDVLSELRELDSKFEFGGVVNYEKGKTYPVKKVSVAEGEKIGLDGFPNFHKSESISGMKKQYYGKDALLIQSGNYIYNVTSEPEIYFRYEHGGSIELPEGSLQHFENYYLEKGGKVGRLPKHVMDFQENDYKKMVQDYPDYPFYSVKNGTIQEIFSEKTEELVAKWNSKKKELTVYNPKYNSEVIVWLKENSFLTSDQVYEIDEMFEEEEYKLGGALLSAWKRERKYVNKSEDYEVRYAKGKNRKGYKKYAKGGEVGDYAKVPVGYNMTHYGLIKKVITNDVLYPEKGYEIAGIGDVLHPEQFEIISSAEFNKLKKQSTEVKPNHFLIIEEEKPNKNELFGKVLLKIRVPYNFEKIVKEEFDFTEYLSKTLTKKWFGNGVFGVKIVNSLFEENFNQYVIVEIDIPIGVTQSKGLDKFDFTEFISKTLTKKWFGNGVWGIDIIETFEKGGVLSKGDEVYIFESRKTAKVISIEELNDLEDEIVVEFTDGATQKMRSSEVMKAENPKANPPYDPNSNLTEEEWKAKHNIQNYGKGGKTEKGQGKGAIFAIAREIRKPGEKWQDAVARAGKLNK